MLSSFLHLFRSDILVLSKHTVLGVFEDLKVLLTLRDFIVQLNLLGDSPLGCLCDPRGKKLNFFVKTLLLFLKLAV